MRAGPIALLLVVLTFAVFAQVRGHELVDWDDSLFITGNPVLADGLSARERWSASVSPVHGNWIPLTQASLLLTHALAGTRPAGFLLGNVLLHALASAVLFLALARMTGALGRSAFVAAVFAVHPLHVESVAWASERKDVLAGLCFALTLLAHARFAERPSSAGRYALVLLALSAGLLSKPTLVTLPCVLLLLDVWPLGRLRGDARAGARRVLLEKLPMLVLVALLCAVTFHVQRTGGGMEFAQRALPLGLRAWNALDSYGMYLVKALWPSELSVFYPHPAESVSRARAAFAGVALAGISAAALALARRRPYLLVGWLWYLGMLVPVIGLVQVGMQARADRYMYLPLIGLTLALAWAAVDLVGNARGRRRALAGAGAVAVALLAVASHRLTASWRDSLSLFGRAVALDPGNLVAQHRLAVALLAAGRLDEAQRRYEETIRLEPRWAEPQLELAALFERRGELAAAAQGYADGLRLDPSHFRGQASLGRVLLHLGRFDEARQALERALTLPGEVAAVHALLAMLAQQLGQDAEAIRQNREALARDPDLLSAANNLAWTLATSADPELRRPSEAVSIAEAAVAELPHADPGFLDTLAVSQAAAGRFQAAIETATRAAQLADEREQPALAAEIRGRLSLFRSQRAWVEPARQPAAR